MAILHEKRKYTYENYCQLPEEMRAEVLEGELLMSPSPYRKHQEISGKIYRILAQWADDHHAGKVYTAPFDVVLSRYNVVQPDLLLFPMEEKGF